MHLKYVTLNFCKILTLSIWFDFSFFDCVWWKVIKSIAPPLLTLKRLQLTVKAQPSPLVPLVLLILAQLLSFQVCLKSGSSSTDRRYPVVNNLRLAGFSNVFQILVINIFAAEPFDIVLISSMWEYAKVGSLWGQGIGRSHKNQ